MHYQRYTKANLETILEEFKQGTPIEQIAEMLGRGAYNIAQKMKILARINSKKWNPKKVRDYIRVEIKKYKRSKGDVRTQRKRYMEKHRSASAVWKEKIKPVINWDRFREYLYDYLEENYHKRRSDFAYETNTYPSQISRYLSGKALPTYKFFTGMADKVGMPYSEFEASFKVK